MKQIIHDLPAPTRAAAERAAEPIRRSFTRSGYELAEELWLGGTTPSSQGDRLAIIERTRGGTLRLVFTHTDNEAPVPSLSGGMHLRRVPGLRVVAAALVSLILVGLILAMGGAVAR